MIKTEREINDKWKTNPFAKIGREKLRKKVVLSDEDEKILTLDKRMEEADDAIRSQIEEN